MAVLLESMMAASLVAQKAARMEQTTAGSMAAGKVAWRAVLTEHLWAVQKVALSADSTAAQTAGMKAVSMVVQSEPLLVEHLAGTKVGRLVEH